VRLCWNRTRRGISALQTNFAPRSTEFCQAMNAIFANAWEVAASCRDDTTAKAHLWMSRVRSISLVRPHQFVRSIIGSGRMCPTTIHSRSSRAYAMACSIVMAWPWASALANSDSLSAARQAARVFSNFASLLFCHAPIES
jgi:hypothetical protein